MTTDSKNNERKVRCPQCGHLTVLSPENKFRPFCSERCKLIDLGEWAKESYRVPTETPADDMGLENISEID